MTRSFILFPVIFCLLLSGCGGSGSSATVNANGTETGNGSTNGSGSGSGTVAGGSNPGSGSGSGTGSSSSACNTMATGQGASLNGFHPFASDNLWNLDISTAPVDTNSTAIINDIGSSIGIHADFGSGQYNGSYMGIPYVVVGAGQNQAVINFNAYGDESDPGPMPVPADAPIEGYPNPGNGDRHVLVLDNSNCWLYELYSAYPGSSGTWNAGSAAVWDLLGDEQRPYTWTSADAAGLPIFPGLVRYDEVAAGQINHALRFTLQHSRAAFVPPASHWAANSSDPLAAPMGMRMRLKASYDISQFSAGNQVILEAMKQYGLIMADNGSSMYVTGAPDDRWDNNDLHQLGTVTASDFEVIQMNPVYTQANVPQGTAPVIASFTATPSIASATTAVTLNWNVTGASYVLISPQLGPVRGASVTVTPGATTTYTLYAANQYGRTTATVTVSVQ